MLSILEVALFFAATIYLPLADVITFYLAGADLRHRVVGDLAREHVDSDVGPRLGSASAAS